jgi:hypothetical protein
VTETQMIGMATTRVTRADRMVMPIAGDVLRDVAVENGACIRPIQLRLTDRETGQTETSWSRAGARWTRFARRAPSGPRHCAPPNAGKAGTSRTNPTSPPAPPPRTSAGGLPCAPKPSVTATRPRRPGRTPPTLTSSSPSSTPRSQERASAARPPRPARPGGTALLAADRTPPTCPSARSTRARSARPTSRRMARPSARPCLSRSPARPTAGSARTARPSTPAPTTMIGLRGTPCISRRCLTGSSRTCAGTWAMTSSTSPPSNPRNGSPRTSTSPCAAPWPVRSCVGSWPPPTTRSGGRTPRPSGSTGTSCRFGTRPPGTTWTRPPAKCCPPGTRPSTPSARMTSRITWRGSGPGLTPRACLRARRTRPGASGT